MDGLYFDDSMEPDDEVFRLRNAVEELAKKKDVTLVTVKCEEKEDFYNTMNAFRHFSEDNIKVFMSTDENIIVVKKDDTKNTEVIDADIRIESDE